MAERNWQALHPGKNGNTTQQVTFTNPSLAQYHIRTNESASIGVELHCVDYTQQGIPWVQPVVSIEPLAITGSTGPIRIDVPLQDVPALIAALQQYLPNHEKADQPTGD